MHSRPHLLNESKYIFRNMHCETSNIQEHYISVTGSHILSEYLRLSIMQL